MKDELKFFLPALFFCQPLMAQPSNVELKEAIQKLEEDALNASPKERSARLLELAKTYYRDQDQERAFRTFLEAVSTTPDRDEVANTADQALYDEALKIYLDPHAQSTRDTASTLLEKYAQTVKEHPEYVQLSFLVAASYANVGKFGDFFDLFYRANQAAPRHYLAYKTKAIIHIKLFERAGTAEEKDAEREKILIEMQKAAEIYPQDHALYKMMIAFSPESQKAEAVRRSLKKIVDSNMVIPRTDLIFYVEEAVKTQQIDAAQELLDRAREWYHYSRIINAAQEFLDQQRKRG